jgi:hypothetical protein
VKRLMMMVPAALVVLSAVTGVAAVAAPASSTTAAETWLLRATWGKPPSWFTVSTHSTQAACEAALVEYRKKQQLGQYSLCKLG